MSFRKKRSPLAAWIVGTALALTGLGSIGLTASAASDSATQDGIEVTFSTDKDSYAADESIVATLSVKNNNQYDVPNVALEHYIPYGYQLADGDSATLSVASLAAGESKTLRVTMLSVPEGTENVVTVAAFTTTSTTTTTVSSDATTMVEGTTDANGSQVSTTGTGVSSTTAATTSTTAANGPKTGDVVSLAVVLLILACAGAFIFFAMKKKRAAILSVALIAGMVGSTKNIMTVHAEEGDGDYVTLSLAVSVGDSSLVLDASVSYEYPVFESPSQDEYYQESADSIVSVVDASQSENALSEKDAIALLASRGFENVEVMYNYQMDGSYVSQTAASADSDTKHPMYFALFFSETSELWALNIVDGSIYASPRGYNISSGQPEVLVSETDTVISYANQTNQFYTTVPKATAVNLKKINKIDADALNQMRNEDF